MHYIKTEFGMSLEAVYLPKNYIIRFVIDGEEDVDRTIEIK